MTTTLIEAKEAAGAANEELVLSVLAAGGDAGVAPAEMGARTGLVERTWRNVVGRLVAKNLARRDRPRGRIYATAAGRSEAGAHLDGVALAGSLGTAIGLFPTEGHRALLRLLLSNVIARHHLRDQLTRNWGSFVVVGPTKAGKTALADFVAQAFGLPRAASIRLAPAMTPGAVWGRTENQGGHWTFYPSPVLGQPFVCLDEVDKTAPQTFASIMRLVQGDAEVAGEEGLVATVAPTVLLCGNGKVSSVRTEYRRRSVVLDLWQHEALLEDVPAAMRAVFADGAIPRLSLAGYRPPGALSPDVLEEMGLMLKCTLTPEGWRELDELAVERMALGRAALVTDQRLAMLATVHDYATCAATVGHVLAVPDSLREALGASPALLAPNIEAAEREAREPVRRAAKRLEDEIEFHRVQGELVEKLGGWLLGLDGRRIPAAQKEVAAGLRKVIRLLRDRAAKQATLEGVNEIWRVARPEVLRAKDLLAHIEQNRTEAERAKVREDDAKAWAAEATKRSNAEIGRRKEEASRRLTAVRLDIGVLEKFYRRSSTKAGERADSALAAFCLRSGTFLLYWQPSGEAPGQVREGRRWKTLGPPGWWRSSFDDAVWFHATQDECSSLAKWGAETRAMLTPALRVLYRQEDQLVAHSGRKARAKRFAL